MLRDGHKTRRRSCIFLTCAVLAAPGPAYPQAQEPRPAFTASDAVSLSVAGLLLLTPRATGLGTGLPDCAPCERDEVPAFDRWAITQPHPAWSWTSHVGLFGVVGLATADLARRPGGARHAVTAWEAGLWVAGATELLKAAVGRPRPVLYTEVAADHLGSLTNARSFPSGHTSVAFAFATSYWLGRKQLTGSPGLPGWLAVVGAAGVGVSRVAAGKHFPSDVLAGAVLGTVSAVVVYEVKF